MLIKIQSDEGLEALRFAIVQQAVNDYLRALKWIRRNPNASKKSKGYIDRHRIKNDCEIFFRSKWFGMLYDLSGEEVMKEIRRNFYNRKKVKWNGKGKNK